jgi:Raf kinase inhibitor-like YbhB/YbcL family protein
MIYKIFRKLLLRFFLLLTMVFLIIPISNVEGGNSMDISSSAFKFGEEIPKKYACDDIDISPPLTWSGAPEGTKSFVLICDDPDAPVGTWIHWVLYNIPAETTQLPENVQKIEVLADNAQQGQNDFRRTGYGGPCPPPGHGYHRYFFKLYAVDTTLNLQAGKATKADVLRAIDGHILIEAKLMGKYKR